MTSATRSRLPGPGAFWLCALAMVVEGCGGGTSANGEDRSAADAGDVAADLTVTDAAVADTAVAEIVGPCVEEPLDEVVYCRQTLAEAMNGTCGACGTYHCGCYLRKSCPGNEIMLMIGNVVLPTTCIYDAATGRLLAATICDDVLNYCDRTSFCKRAGNLNSTCETDGYPGPHCTKPDSPPWGPLCD